MVIDEQGRKATRWISIKDEKKGFRREPKMKKRREPDGSRLLKGIRDGMVLEGSREEKSEAAIYERSGAGQFSIVAM